MGKTRYIQEAKRERKRPTGKYKALGLMSGTSLDGVDAAIIETDGERVLGFGATHFRPYTDDEKNILAMAGSIRHSRA